MKTYAGHYSQDEIAKRLFAIEDELTQYWKDNSYAVTDEEIQLDFRQRIEAASFGRNTVRFSAAGLPMILVKFEPNEKALLSYLYGDSTAGIHPAFVIDGVVKTWYFAKYLAGRVGSTNYAVSLRGLDPANTITHDASITLVKNRSDGAHMATTAEWGYISLLAMRNAFQSRGNTHYGRHHVQTDEYGVGVISSGDRYGRTLTGSGPYAWSHDGTPFGVFDLVGNVWKWAAGMRIVDGEIQVFANNNAAGTLSTLAAHAVASADWKAIDINGNLVTPEADLDPWADATPYMTGNVVMNDGVRYKATGDHTSATATEPGTGVDWETVWVREGTLHYRYTGSALILSDYAGGLDPSTSRTATFSSMTSDITPPDIVKQLGLYPKTSAGPLGTVYARDAERMPFRGGCWDSTSGAGLGALGVYNVRGNSHGSIGLALAYQE